MDSFDYKRLLEKEKDKLVPAEIDRWVTDKELSALTGFSISTFRGQRHRRRQGLEHWFTLDPVPNLHKPRYRWSEVCAWMSAYNVKKESE